MGWAFACIHWIAFLLEIFFATVCIGQYSTYMIVSISEVSCIAIFGMHIES